MNIPCISTHHAMVSLPETLYHYFSKMQCFAVTRIVSELVGTLFGGEVLTVVSNHFALCIQQSVSFLLCVISFTSRFTNGHGLTKIISTYILQSICTGQVSTACCIQHCNGLVSSPSAIVWARCY